MGSEYLVQIQIPPFLCSVSLDKLLNLPPLFPSNTIYLIRLWRGFNMMLYIKYLQSLKQQISTLILAITYVATTKIMSLKQVNLHIQ